LFNFPESYERLENIVKSYPADKFNLLEAHTMFSTQSNDSKGALTIKAHSYPPADVFINVMNFSTGELNFNSHFKNEDISLRSGFFGFKYKRTSRPVFSNFIEVVSRLKVLTTLK
jgi:hypothetical protein